MKSIIHNDVCSCSSCNVNFEFTKDEVEIIVRRNKDILCATTYWRYAIVSCPICHSRNILNKEQITRDDYELNKEEEATLAAIDAALDYLVKTKEEENDYGKEE